MLGRVQPDCRLQNRHRAIGQLEGWIILPLPIQRVVLTQADGEHLGYVEDARLAGELLQITVNLTLNPGVESAGAANTASGVSTSSVLQQAPSVELPPTAQG